jgi:hypothetical protein
MTPISANLAAAILAAEPEDKPEEACGNSAAASWSISLA